MKTKRMLNNSYGNFLPISLILALCLMFIHISCSGPVEYTDESTVRHHYSQGKFRKDIRWSSFDTTRYDAPPKGKTIINATPADFLEKIAAASEGQEIILADGIYGSITITASGSNDNPVILRAANRHKAVFNGTIYVKGKFIWLHDIKFTNPTNYGIIIQNDYLSVTRCLFTGLSGIQAAVGGISYSKIGYNAFYPFRELSDEDSRKRYSMIRYEARFKDLDNKTLFANHIYNNHFIVQASSQAAADYNYLFIVNDPETPRYPYMCFLVENNLVEGSGRRGTFYLKTTGSLLRNNTILANGPGYPYINFRIGNDNWAIGNYTEGDVNLWCLGRDNGIIGNRLNNIMIFAGNMDPYIDDPNIGQDYPYALRTEVAGNTGKVILGFDGWTALKGKFPAKDTRISHSGEMEYGNHAGTDFNWTPPYPVPVPRKITTDEVGPFAKPETCSTSDRRQ